MASQFPSTRAPQHPGTSAPRLRSLHMPGEIHAAVERVRGEVMQALSGPLLSPAEPFLGDLTLGQYMELPDEDRARLWDEWAGIDLEELEELDVRPDAVSAG